MKQTKYVEAHISGRYAIIAAIIGAIVGAFAAGFVANRSSVDLNNYVLKSEYQRVVTENNSLRSQVSSLEEQISTLEGKVISHNFQEEEITDNGASEPQSMPEKESIRVDFASLEPILGKAYFFNGSNRRDNYLTTYQKAWYTYHGDSPDGLVYYLNNNYTLIKGTIALDYESRETKHTAWLEFYDHETGKLLYQSEPLGREVEPIPFKVDVTGVNKLRIERNGSSSIAVTVLYSNFTIE